MTCVEFQRVLPDLMEGAGSVEQAAHLKSCPMCAGLVSDLNAIAEQARELRASEEPSPRVWNSIEIALKREGLIRQPQRERPPLLTPVVRRWSPGAAWLVPVAAVVVIALGLVLFQRGSSPSEVTRQPALVSTTGTTQPPMPASGDKDDQQLLEVVASKAPSMRETYEANLHNVNAYIRDAQQSVETDPNDEEARQSLIDAYDQKAMLYAMALDRSLP